MCFSLFQSFFTKSVFLLIFISLNVFGQENGITWKEAQRQKEDWYATQEAQRIADNVILYQHHNGGWVKNINMAETLTASEKDQLKRVQAQKVGTTIDNGATHTQMRFLAKVDAAQPSYTYRDAFVKGVDFLLEAQYENGGWPQFYPKKEGYYEHVTYNDNAMIGVMYLLKAVADGEDPYVFIDGDHKEKVRQAIDKGLKAILKTQIRIDGRLTVWCAQYDKDYLSPAKARAYELPSLSGSESVGIVNYLMQLQNPSEEVKNAVRSAVHWFQENKITGKKVKWVNDSTLPEGKDRIVVDDATGGPLWTRFNEIGTNRTMFVGRDGVVKNQLSEIEHERRIGYSYLSNYAENLLKKNFPAWQKKYPETNAREDRR